MHEDKLKAAQAARRATVFGVVSGALIAIYGLYISREHITEIGYWMRLRPMEAETLFIFIDVVAIYGKVLMGKHFVAKTRRIGVKFLIGAGAASLACNIGSGLLTANYGAACYGAFIVAIIAALEYAVANTKARTYGTNRAPRQPKVKPATIKPAAPTAGRKCPPGCLCGRHARTAGSNIPVSPGMGPVSTYAGAKA